MSSCSTKSQHIPKIDILITLCEKPPKLPCAMNLREVDDDMQTLCINAAVDTFEFKASPKDGGTVEGIIRYHPFLYDKETYPKDPDALLDDDDDEDNGYDNESGAWHQAASVRKEPIFVCFWNGRLIPYTKVPEFDWCTATKGTKELAECYNRISGVLFSDDTFEVTTNKLTFMDLELKLKKKDTFFTRIVNSQKQRGKIQKELTQWLKNCHEKWDKEVKFLGYVETITRTDILAKKMQHPWATFSSIEWDGKIYTIGQLVKSQKTVPILYGRVVRFLLHGKYDGDVFATGGEVEVVLEPKAFYDKTKTIPISKIDKNATDEAIKNYIDNDSAKLPELLTVSWPERNPWPLNAAQPAGTQFGPIKVEILNKKGEKLSTMPSLSHGAGKKLIIELKVVQHDPKPDDELLCYAAQHSGKWGFWFKKIERLTKQGKYTLSLTTKINGNNATTFGDRELPSFKLNFTIKAGCAETFVIGEVNTTHHVGVPFNIPLQIEDGYGHSATLPPDLKPVLTCSGLDLSYEAVDNHGTTFIIKTVKARGRVLIYQQSKTYDLKVTLPGLKTDTQSIKICLLPGNPHSLHVTPEDDTITVENGNPVTFNIEIHDEAGNITAHPKQIVCCKVDGLPSVGTDCSTGAGQLVTKQVNLKITNGEPQNLNAKFEMPSQKKLPLVVRQLKVLPSTRVSRMELCSNDNLVLINNEQIEWLAGGSLDNLFYKLFDEAGREVPLTAEIASMIKVNWAGDVNTEELIQGKLPVLHVTTQVQPPLFYQVSYQDQNVSFSFYLVPRPDEPSQLKATLLPNTMKLGEILSENIRLELLDQYDNLTKTLTSSCKNHMTVEAEGLDKSAIAFVWQESSRSVLVTGLQFQSGPLGPRELRFTYRSFVQLVTVKVTAGVPAQLKLVSGPEEPLQVLNDQGIATPFLIQLFDEWGNPTTDQRVVVMLSSSSPSLKVTSDVTSQPVNAEGNASFTVSSVSGPKGYYHLEFKGSHLKPIPGPKVNLTVIPDPNKPVSLSVEYNTSAVLPAGYFFPVFSVTVVSDEGSPMTTFNPAAVSMFLWKGEPSGNTPPPQMVTELKCSKPTRNEKNDRFHFRDKEIPEHVGKYTIQFSLQIGNRKVLFSNQIAINVVANQPVKLGPDSEPPTPVVSDSKDIANRTLVENMTLRIMDSYGNPAGKDLDGKLVVSMKNSSGDANKKLPLFEGKTNSTTIRLIKGKAHITRLVVMENSPGENGSTYVLVFKPEGLMVPTPLTPYELPFHFSNDADNQRKMTQLSIKKNELIKAIAARKEIISTFEEILQLLTNQHLVAREKEIALRNNLMHCHVKICQNIPDVDRLLKEKETEAESILNAPRRVYSIRDPFSGQQDVLGMVGHLAFVQDDDAARVISWHISGDMNCVITKTTAAAQSIYQCTQGMQQVMALDSVYVPPGNGSMPHIRNGRMLFEPPGNPIHARDLLKYPDNPESCKIAFKNILGNTILIDDLDSANNYRKAVVQFKQPCPTILTRKGDRVSGKGKFGGAQNRAPPINRLQVFGAPIPDQYYTLKQHIELLKQHRSTMEKRAQAVKELEDYSMKSPENMERQQEMEDKMKQLEEIERQLVSTPVRPVKRGLEGAGEPSSIISKRAK